MSFWRINQVHCSASFLCLPGLGQSWSISSPTVSLVPLYIVAPADYSKFIPRAFQVLISASRLLKYFTLCPPTLSASIIGLHLNRKSSLPCPCVNFCTYSLLWFAENIPSARNTKSTPIDYRISTVGASWRLTTTFDSVTVHFAASYSFGVNLSCEDVILGTCTCLWPSWY